MKISGAISENNKKIWISITGYRILLIFKSLLEKGRTVDELVNILKSDSVTSKSFSKDTVRLTIKTLKAAGCIFNRPSKTNGFKYEIIKHPFTLNISEDNLKVLSMLRDRFSFELDVESVFALNRLYDKIISLTQNEEFIVEISNSKPLSGINIDIFKELSSSKLMGKKLNIQYSSPKFGEENLDIITQKLTYENGKLYLWCYIYKYKTNSILNLERIRNINVITFSDSIDTDNHYEVVYELFGLSNKTFQPDDYEEIIDIKEKSTVIKVKVYNEFLFIQRLLLFGADFKIVSPDSFKEKLINKLKLIKKGYDNYET